MLKALVNVCVQDLTDEREVTAEVPHKQFRGLAAHARRLAPWEQHDDLHDAAGSCYRRVTLPAAREFEVNDFFINLEVAFSQETDLLRCNDMCGEDGYLGPLTL